MKRSTHLFPLSGGHIFRWLLCALLMLAASPLSAGILRGHIDKRDTVVSPAAYAMAYVPSIRMGVTADENGDFQIRLPAALEGKSVAVEFSLIGYESLEKTLTVAHGEADAARDSVILNFAPIMLAASYVTADGSDPAKYILSKVWETADANRKKAWNYSADVNYTLTTHNLSLVTKIVPGFTLFWAKIAAGFMGIGPLVNYSTTHDDFTATVSLHRDVKNGVQKDTDRKILEMTDRLPKDVQQNVLSIFGKVNLYGLLYGSQNAWGRKFTRRSDFVLTGSYNYGDYIVDILQWKDPDSDASATIHVIEDLWQILKVQVGRGEEAVLCEARDMGNGIFMPVSFIMQPTLTRVKARDIPAFIEIVKREKMDKNIRKRAIKLLEEYYARGEDFNPYIVVRFNVRYQ